MLGSQQPFEENHMSDLFSWFLSSPYPALALVFGYLLGSIPFGLIVTKFAGTEDIRSIGSGNIGATNVLRTGRKGLAAATLLGDALKGTVAVLVAAKLGQSIGVSGLALIAGFGAFLGHLFPIWLNFKGGKGVATYLGVLLGLWWPGALAFAALWLVVAYLTRYSSLAALIGGIFVPVLLYFYGFYQQAALFCVLTGFLLFMHRANIQRLLAGSEGKIGQKG
jgi:acyl phosphate:glycerol-3-phosphate acyltransferase